MNFESIKKFEETDTGKIVAEYLKTRERHAEHVDVRRILRWCRERNLKITRDQIDGELKKLQTLGLGTHKTPWFTWGVNFKKVFMTDEQRKQGMKLVKAEKPEETAQKAPKQEIALLKKDDLFNPDEVARTIKITRNSVEVLVPLTLSDNDKERVREVLKDIAIAI